MINPVEHLNTFGDLAQHLASGMPRGSRLLPRCFTGRWLVTKDYENQSLEEVLESYHEGENGTTADLEEAAKYMVPELTNYGIRGYSFLIWLNRSGNPKSSPPPYSAAEALIRANSEVRTHKRQVVRFDANGLVGQ